MTDNEESVFVVKSENPNETRRYVKVYHDFLDTELLNRNEKMLFIMLKRYLDFRLDDNGIDGKVFPNLKTLARQCGMTQKTVRTTLQSLESKGVISIRQRGLNKSNEYVLRDYSSIWRTTTEEEAQTEIRRARLKLAEDIAREYGYSLKKEKELVTRPTKAEQQAHDSSIHQHHISKNPDEFQERYSMEDVKIFFNYDILKEKLPYYIVVDTIMSILYDTLNTSKATIRIAGEEKPANIVIGKLMKLTYMDIEYVIEKYSKQTEEIKNPIAYITTMLYKAKEQAALEYSNQVAYNAANWSEGE